MRFSRLVIETPTTTVSLALHPRLTVITGIADDARGALCRELTAALVGSDDGVHAELVEDAGRTLKIFRPTNRAHRVIDATSGVDTTLEFAEHGRVDLLRRYEIGPADLQPIDEHTCDHPVDDDVPPSIDRLARLDQARLWALAQKIELSAAELAQPCERTGRTVDAALVDLVEDRHTGIEQADARARRIRWLAAGVTLVAALGTIPSALRSPTLAVVPAAIAVVGVLITLVASLRLRRARAAAEQALEAAGAENYLSYMVKRVDGLIDDSVERRRLDLIADDRRASLVEWDELVGDLSPAVALEQRDAVGRVVHTRTELASIAEAHDASAPGDTPVAGDRSPVEIAAHLLTRLGRARRDGRHPESLPLIIDDVFSTYDQHTVDALLDLVDRHAGPPQVVVVTGCGPVADWAHRRDEAAHNLGVLGPEAVAGDRGGVLAG